MSYLITFRNRILALAATSLTIIAVVLTALILRYVNSVRKEDTQKIIWLSCQENANKVNEYIKTTEQSVKVVGNYLKRSFEEYGFDSNMSAVMDRAQVMSSSAAINIDPCVSCFMRPNPDIFPDNLGFYSVRSDDGFKSIKPSNLSKYDKDDIRVDWFYGTLNEGTARWTAPYQDPVTGIYIINYVVPIFNEGKSVGVVGMELSVDEINSMINETHIYYEGQVYLTDRMGNVILENDREIADRVNSEDWVSASQLLHNSMTITVAAPSSVIKRDRAELIKDIIIITVISVIIAMAMSLFAVIRVFASLEQKAFDIQESKNKAIDATNRANQAKMEFLSRMSHDIRTPLNGIIGMLEILRRNRDDDEKVDDCLEKIDMSANHLLSLVNDILDLQKLENGKMSFAMEPFDLQSIIDHCVDIISAQAEKDNVKLKLKIISMEHTRLIGSSLRIRQILLNILSNAVKYNKTGGEILFIVEELSAKDDYATYKFTIQDNGIGMSPEYLKRVFERFSQEHDDARTKYKGTGLGLYITKAIVDELGGNISVVSELDEGSIFTVLLPIAIDRSEPNALFAGTEDKDKIIEAECRGMNVLLVEDNPLNLEIAQQLLEDSGIIVETALNGQEAVRVFAGKPPGTYDVILMDIMMPLMDGYEATRAIRSFAREDAGTIPILAMTANAFEEDVRKCKEAGMNEHIAKPLDMNRVLTLLAQYKKK